MGFDDDWPSAAYEEVMESMTDWAFSWPISRTVLAKRGESSRRGGRTLVVVDDVAQVVPAGVVRLAHAHRVVREVHIAVITWGRLGTGGNRIGGDEEDELSRGGGSLQKTVQRLANVV